MVIAYLLYAVLFKDIVNSALVFAIFFFFFFTFFRKKVNINIYLGRILLEYFIFIHVEQLVLQVFTTAEW